MIVNIETDLQSIHFPSRLLYTIARINAHPLFPNDLTLNINHPEGADKTIHYKEGFSSLEYLTIEKQNFFFRNKIPHNISRWVHRSIEGWRLPLYALSHSTPTSPLVISNRNLPFDIFEAVFFHLSRLEELDNIRPNDAKSIHEFENQLLTVRSGTSKTPVIDHLIVFLAEWITGIKVIAPTTLSITHDVDILTKWTSPFTLFRKLGGHLLHRQSLQGYSLLIKQFINYLKKGIDPYNTFSWLLNNNPTIHKELYLLIGGNHRWDTPISINHPLFLDLIQWAKDTHYTVGIHPSFDSWNQLSMIIAEKKILEDAAGVNIDISRQHFLNFDIRVTPDLLLKSGIKKDSSLGFARRVGFRCGTGFDYPLYNFTLENESELIESPLAFMDSACLHESLESQESFEDIFDRFFTNNKEYTRIVCNFHNSFPDEAEMRGISFKERVIQLYTEWPGFY